MVAVFCSYIMIINSKQNAKVKFYASLKEKKYRQKHGLYLVEGVKMVREAIKYNQKIKCIIGESDKVSEYVNSGIEILEVTGEVLSAICDTKTPQGVVAVLEMPNLKPKKLSGVSVCLDGVSDNGNLGTILRILTAVGITELYLINSVDVYAPKTVRSSMSGIYNVNVYNVTADEFIELSNGVPLIIADMNGENVFNFEPPKAFSMIFGSEAHGVSEKLKNLATHVVKIPMENNLESLNVGVSAGIILYQLINKI